MDDITYNLLKRMALEKIQLITLKEFEDEDLLEAKKNRTWAEYCWTCTASLILFLFKKYPELEIMTYLDADLYFFNDPKPFFDEFNNSSIFITKNNLAPEYKRLSVYGKYSVQFNIFRNNEDSLKALNWWRKKTINWCRSRSRNLFHFMQKKKQNMQGGDQIYLENWPLKFKNVQVLKNEKLCLAPFNISQYPIFLKNNTIHIEDSVLIFYHFHSFEINEKNNFTLADGAYKITKKVRELIYFPYINEIKNIMKEVKEIEPDFNYGIIKKSFKQKTLYLMKKTLYSFYRLRLKLEKNKIYERSNFSRGFWDKDASRNQSHK
ncbi:MAG: hypothetical protein PHH35_02395 [Candidatus Pacebacteria bacterium]|nr:hypothetical protein [Candidatus Paceibacterota bacterium]